MVWYLALPAVPGEHLAFLFCQPTLCRLFLVNTSLSSSVSQHSAGCSWSTPRFPLLSANTQPTLWQHLAFLFCQPTLCRLFLVNTSLSSSVSQHSAGCSWSTPRFPLLSANTLPAVPGQHLAFLFCQPTLCRLFLVNTSLSSSVSQHSAGCSWSTPRFPLLSANTLPAVPGQHLAFLFCQPTLCRLFLVNTSLSSSVSQHSAGCSWSTPRFPLLSANTLPAVPGQHLAFLFCQPTLCRLFLVNTSLSSSVSQHSAGCSWSTPRFPLLSANTLPAVPGQHLAFLFCQPTLCRLFLVNTSLSSSVSQHSAGCSWSTPRFPLLSANTLPALAPTNTRFSPQRTLRPHSPQRTPGTPLNEHRHSPQRFTRHSRQRSRSTGGTPVNALPGTPVNEHWVFDLSSANEHSVLLISEHTMLSL